VPEQKEIDSNIDILYSNGVINIRLYDDNAGVKFIDLELSPEDFCDATMGRLSRLRCKAEVSNLDKVGKTLKIDHITYKIDNNTIYNNDKREELARTKAIENCPEGWTPDLYFGSQNSFTHKGDELWAKCIIRKWV